MGKFFKGKVKKDRTTLIKYIIIGIGIFLIILLFILIAIRNSNGKNAVLEVKDSLVMEAGNNFPDKMEYVTNIKHYNKKNITVDYKDINPKVPGEYKVTLNAKGIGSADIDLTITDTTAPELKVKDVTLASSTSYTPLDFVESCSDNSIDECIVEFYSGSQDQNGNTIDYSKYTENGTYIIKLVAKDSKDNSSDIKEATLVIGSGEGTVKPVDCQYGTLETNSTGINYPIAVVVGDKTTGCALNRDLWDNEKVQEPVKKFYQTDYEKLKKELESTLKAKFPGGANIVAYPHFIAVLNNETKGLVGYGIYVKVYISSVSYKGEVDKDENLVLAYYLNQDGSRKYDTNKYNLK